MGNLFIGLLLLITIGALVYDEDFKQDMNKTKTKNLREKEQKEAIRKIPSERDKARAQSNLTFLHMGWRRNSLFSNLLSVFVIHKQDPDALPSAMKSLFTFIFTLIFFSIILIAIIVSLSS